MRYYYKTLELKDYDQPHEVRILNRIDSRSLMVEFFPPISASVYKTKDDLRRAVIMSRYSKRLYPLFLLNSKIINLCLQDQNEGLGEGSYKILDLGKLTRRWV